MTVILAIVFVAAFTIGNMVRGGWWFGNPYEIHYKPQWILGALGYALMPIGFTLAKISSIIPPSKQWLADERINGLLQGLFWGIALT